MLCCCREEINYLRTNKPNFAERRTIIDLSEEPSAEKEGENEEKKMEDATANQSNTIDSTENNMPSKETDSEDSAASDEVVHDVHVVVSMDEGEDEGQGSGENTTEDETTIDIAAADSLSLFKKLLTMTNKTGAPSGTMALNNAGNDAEGGQNKIITPTILQNGRPVRIFFETVKPFLIYVCVCIFFNDYHNLTSPF